MPLAAGLSIAGVALLASQAVHVAERWAQHGPPKVFSSATKARKYYQGGFAPQMTRREAALILGVREYAPHEKIKEAHLKLMKACWLRMYTEPCPRPALYVTHFSSHAYIVHASAPHRQIILILAVLISLLLKLLKQRAFFLGKRSLLEGLAVVVQAVAHLFERFLASA